MIKWSYLFCLSLFFCTATSKAQVLKGIKDKISNRLANGLSKKNTEKSSVDVDSVMRKLDGFNMDNNTLSAYGVGMGMLNSSVLPDAYLFTHLYRIRMKSSMGTFDMDYLLTQSGNYLGSEVTPKESMKVVMVYDYEKKLIVNYLNGKPMVMRLPEVGSSSEEGKDTAYVVTNLPNKKFLGYDCFGRQMENEEYLLTLYVAPDLGVGMCNPFENQTGNSSPALRLNKKSSNGGLIMHMDIKDKKNKGDKNTSGTMECILFEKKQTVIKNR